MEKGKVSRTKQNILDGIELFKKHPIFSYMYTYMSRDIVFLKKDIMGKNIKSYVEVKCKEIQKQFYPTIKIYLNENVDASPKDWSYILAHDILHVVFGHFDFEKMPWCMKENASWGSGVGFDKSLWNKACDIYVTKFLADIKFGEPLNKFDENDIKANLHDETSIYDFLLHNNNDYKQTFGVADEEHLDMLGLDNPIVWRKGNNYERCFASAIVNSVDKVIAKVSEDSFKRQESNFDTKTSWGKAAAWFLNSYPLLGGVASSFKIIDDKKTADRYDIRIAAIDVDNGEIIINPGCDYDYETWKFILAHEYLHAGLSHAERCQGRDRVLWNIACDYVINGWLHEMNIGTMPEEGLYYDPKLKGRSAEDIYDEIIKNAKKYIDMLAFGVRGKGDIIVRTNLPSNKYKNGVPFDDFCKTALMEGLEYHKGNNYRGFIPAGLEEEIRALAMPAIPWDVELGKWFDEHFTPKALHRSYARPSRRQSSTPDIPRPRSIPNAKDDDNRTFGVVVDTSGSMSTENLAKALGSIASYANAKEVDKVRVIFCDADAYDAGYLATEDIAGRVKMIGRGGTELQPAVDLLEEAKDFPKDGPILLITDGYIEERMQIRRDHAFLIPRGNHLPFKPKGKVFYFR